MKFISKIVIALDDAVLHAGKGLIHFVDEWFDITHKQLIKIVARTYLCASFSSLVYDLIFLHQRGWQEYASFALSIVTYRAIAIIANYSSAAKQATLRDMTLRGFRTCGYILMLFNLTALTIFILYSNNILGHCLESFSNTLVCVAYVLASIPDQEGKGTRKRKLLNLLKPVFGSVWTTAPQGA